ncbi:hypothetical protein FVEG_16795 [Fusarium verticillioides 7600]|uniref:LYR motif-containing protein Cup1-like N-terminal domain-containing protein n=1 Tax=Gibberella moniliformis (strain M3125 / FGSC 7600) TaxID=334819 RepID=W7N4A1_GIBM7|nr:hypothetical protein FVEG_16795 [Fusarium verticillioides 7600]EWG51442.1 hypothetical protein FVEG_16795 [Fusarium verticillioides 7600]RBQ95795.1 hypothetical protein FVER53263_20532 [Fusarium verticillioides]
MPRPHFVIPTYLPPLHLYRHILRETSYLPPAIRPEVTHRIRTRFRSHRKYDRHQNRHRVTAVNLLRKLRAANSGKQTLMEDLIMEAFGRTGARRRSLLSDFIKLEPPSNSDALEALIQGVEAHEKSAETVELKAIKLQADSSPHKPAETAIDSQTSTNPPKDSNETPGNGEEPKAKAPLVRKGPKPLQPAFYAKWDTEKLRKLLRSQRDLQQSARLSWPHRDIKSLQPDSKVPSQTIWGKSPTPNIYQAKRAKFWKRISNKTMPPLGKDEWDLLGRLSSGAQQEDQWKVPERRPVAKPSHGSTTKSDTWDWEGYASRPASQVERQSPLSVYGLVGRNKEKHPYQPRLNHQEYSPRWFRRAYQRVWQFTPKMDPDSKPDKLKFIWGALTTPAVPPTRAQLAIFEDVDSKGKKPNPPSRSQRAPYSQSRTAANPLETQKS